MTYERLEQGLHILKFAIERKNNINHIALPYDQMCIDWLDKLLPFDMSVEFDSLRKVVTIRGVKWG